MTGRYAVRMGLTGSEAEDSAPVLIYAAGRAGLPENETTLAEVARRSGYRTAAVGKVRSLKREVKIKKHFTIFSGTLALMPTAGVINCTDPSDTALSISMGFLTL